MLALLASAVMTADAYAQASYPCVNDAPNPYKLAANWAQTPRTFGPTNAVTVDSKDNIWVFDRCGDMGCSGSKLSPIYELSPAGKTMKNIGAGQFVSAHGIAVDKDGNVWAADFQAKDGKGMQVVKLSPDGKVLLKVGKAGEPGLGDDAFNAPTGVAVLSTGEILIAEGHDVVSAENGAEALVKANGEALVLLDMRMPVLDGWGFAREFRAAGKRSPIVVMTAAENASRWAEEIGAEGYLAKPFEIDALIAAVERHATDTH